MSPSSLDKLQISLSFLAYLVGSSIDGFIQKNLYWTWPCPRDRARGFASISSSISHNTLPLEVMIHFICTAGSWDLEKSSDLPRIPGESSDFNLAVSLLGLALDGSPSLSAPCHLACESCHLGCCCHTSLRLESSWASSQELSLSHFILVTLSSPRTCLAEAASV